jgi:hypothetical protein
MVVARDWGRKDYYLIDIEFQFGKVKTLWKWKEVMVI